MKFDGNALRSSRDRSIQNHRRDARGRSAIASNFSLLLRILADPDSEFRNLFAGKTEPRSRDSRGSAGRVAEKCQNKQDRKFELAGPQFFHLINPD
jgi:hypothetical protein